MRPLALLLPALALGGCVSTAKTIVLAPAHAASFTADKLTTSRAEADRNLGRKVRKQRERDAKACRHARKEARREDGALPACDTRD